MLSACERDFSSQQCIVQLDSDAEMEYEGPYEGEGLLLVSDGNISAADIEIEMRELF